MRELKINIKQTADLDWLLEAANEVVNATESDFTDMQSKAWYKRLWEVITFSKDNEVHLATGVSNLAKLQEIVIRAMLVVSRDNAIISNEVARISKTIGKLATIDTRLLQEIDKIKYGENRSAWFSELAREKKAIMVSLVIMADRNAEQNIASKQYISSLLKLAGIAIFEPISIENIDRLTLAEQEFLYQMIVIHRHLLNVAYDAESMVVDELSIKKRRKEEILEAIKTTSENVTPEFFSSFYEESSNACSMMDEFGLLLVETGAVDEMDHESFQNDFSACEEITIQSILHIEHGETLRYQNKVVHLQSLIECEGTLEFNNCEIHYGETEYPPEINLPLGAMMVMNGCTVVCHQDDGHTLINATTEELIKFNHCVFDGCANFINAHIVEMLRCKISNASECFVCAPKASFYKCDFVFEKGSDSIYEKGIVHCSKELQMSECSINGKAALDRANVFYSNDFSISTSIFKNAANLFSGTGRAKDCTFEGCESVFKFTENIDLTDCCFNNCTEIIYTSGKALLVGCKFDKCYNTLIDAMFSNGGSRMEICEFDGWENREESKERDSYSFFADAMIKFHSRKNGATSTICKSIFHNATAGLGYLVIGNASEKLKHPVAIVEKCRFEGCVTERKDGKLIREFCNY